MLNSVKYLIRKLFRQFSIELRNCRQTELSDDPYLVISRIINANDELTIIDGGASIGDTTVKITELFPNAIVHAFEPFPEFIKVLNEKANLNSRIKVHPVGLGIRDCTAQLKINKSRGTNSIFETNTTSSEIYGSQLLTERSIEIPLINLDKWFKSKSLTRIDILKLDLQGAELNALNGAVELLKKGKVKIILCEFMFIEMYQNQPKWVELVNILLKYNFLLFNFYQKHFHYGQILQANAIFIHNSILEDTKQNRLNKFFKNSDILIK
jgi:FkbM family methyltransferase